MCVYAVIPLLYSVPNCLCCKQNPPQVVAPHKSSTKITKEYMLQGLAVASGVVGAALPAIWSVLQHVADPFSDEKDNGRG